MNTFTDECVCAIVQVHVYKKIHFCSVIVINIFLSLVVSVKKENYLLNNFQSLIKNVELSPVFMTNNSD